MREAIDYTNQTPIKQIKTRSNFTAKQYDDGCIIINGIRFYGYTAKEAIRLYKDRVGNVLRLGDGCEALAFSGRAACTKPLLAAGLSHKLNRNETKRKSKRINSPLHKRVIECQIFN